MAMLLVAPYTQVDVNGYVRVCDDTCGSIVTWEDMVLGDTNGCATMRVRARGVGQDNDQFEAQTNDKAIGDAS